MAMTRYVGGRQIRKKLPGPPPKSSLEISLGNGHAIQNEVQGEESIRLQTQVAMEYVQETMELRDEVEQVGMWVKVEVEHLDQYSEAVACPKSDTQSAIGKGLRLQMQKFGLNENSDTASFPRIKHMRGGIRRKKSIVLSPMIRYVCGWSSEGEEATRKTSKGCCGSVDKP